jgi:hypothetical protein
VCPKQIKRDWPKVGLSEQRGRSGLLCVRSAPARRTRPSRLLNSTSVAARWREGIGIGIGIGIGMVPLHFVILSPTRLLASPSLSPWATSAPQQKVPVFQKKHRVPHGLHMQQSHSSRNGCRLVAVMASFNACVLQATAKAGAARQRALSQPA